MLIHNLNKEVTSKAVTELETKISKTKNEISSNLNTFKSELNAQISAKVTL